MTEPDRPIRDPNAGAAAPVGASGLVPGLRTRVAGFIQIAAGLFLLVLMGTITWRMAPMLLAAPAVLPDGSRFNASAGAGRLVLALFGSVLLFGMVALGIGIRQLVTGIRPRRLLPVLWGAAGLILVLIVATVVALKQGPG